MGLSKVNHLKMRTVVIPLYFILYALYFAPFPPGDSSIRAERARALIERSRMSIGGEDAICRVQSLSVKGKIKRYVKYVSVRSPKSVEERERTLSGSIELDFSYPDKFRRKYSTEVLRGFDYSYTEVVNGERAWRNPPLRAISSHRDGRVIDVEDFERTTQLQARGARQQITYYSLAFLLQGIPVFPLQYNYLGQLETTSGQSDVVSAQGPENFQIFLLFDPKTAFPRALAFAYIDSVHPVVLVEAPGLFDRRMMQMTWQRAREERRLRTGPPRRHELQMQFSDYRPVDGIMLPHRIKHILNGELIEEVFFDQYKINQQIKPKKFEGEQKPAY